MSTHDDPAEVARAQAHRDQESRRRANDRARLDALSGSRLARAALADRWSALRPDPNYPEQAPAAPTP